MDIDRVRYFHVFAEMGSLVKASEVLNISQPALSKAFRLLSYEAGVPLLEPDGRGLRLTKAGQNFQKQTATLLKQWLDVPKLLAESKIHSPTKIGSFEVFTTYFLGELTKHIELESLEIHEFGPGRLEDAVAEGIIDIGMTYVPIPKPLVEFVEAVKIKMGVFGLKKYMGVPTEELPFVIPLQPHQGTPSKVMGLDGWPDHKHPRNIKYRVTLMGSALELCRQGDCVAYLPEFVAILHNRSVLPHYRLAELANPISAKERLQSVYLVRHQSAVESKLHNQIGKCLRSISKLES
jgi:DNA-binding transcriptional LysR family regulator